MSTSEAIFSFILMIMVAVGIAISGGHITTDETSEERCKSLGGEYYHNSLVVDALGINVNIDEGGFCINTERILFSD